LTIQQFDDELIPCQNTNVTTGRAIQDDTQKVETRTVKRKDKDMEFIPALFSTRVTSGRRTFFFDVKATKDDKPYIKITESSITPEGEKKKNYMTIFNSELDEFKQAIDEAIGFVSVMKTDELSPKPTEQ
jgi:hypothetical protein